MQTLFNMKVVVESHPVVNHQFLEAFRKGKLTKEQVHKWFVQQFFFSRSLPSCFAALYARVDNRFWKEKRALVDLLDVEAWGSTNATCHSGYFVELGAFLGVDLSAVTEEQMRPYTANYLAFRLDLCLNPSRSLGQGLAAIALANEVVNLSIFQAYREGINKIPGLETCPTGYFDAHLRDEQHDFEVFAQLYELMAKTLEDRRAAQRAVIRLLNKRKFFFDYLYQDLRRG